MGKRLGVVVLAAMAAITALLLVGGAGAVGASKFESADGNLVVNTAGNTDWASGAPNLAVGVDLPTGTGDNSFGNGSKEDEVDVTVGLGSIPNSKADLARFAIAGENIGGDTYVYLAWSRENQSGTVNFDFELNAVAQPDLTTAGPKHLNRSVNDLLINYAFSGGSNTPTLTLRKWTGSAWGAEQNLTSAGCADGLTNGATVSENLGGNTAVNRPAQQFGEAGVNLTCAGVIPKNSCASFADSYVKSRSSTSFSSEIKDFIAPVQVSLSNCAKLTIVKHTSPADIDQNFGFTSGTGLSPGTFTLNDHGTDTQVFSSLQPGTYSVAENANPTGFALASISCTPKGTGTLATRTASVTLAAGDDVTCTFVNNQQLGAIKVLKRSIKGNTALAGATFSIAGQSVTTGSDGTACVENLAFGNYDVSETAAPTGYQRDDTTTHSVAVNANRTCADITAANALAFNDTPLTDISVTVNSQDDGAGGTLSTISCVKGANTEGSATSAHDPSVSMTNKTPGTYVCTVVVDP